MIFIFSNTRIYMTNEFLFVQLVKWIWRVWTFDLRFGSLSFCILRLYNGVIKSRKYKVKKVISPDLLCLFIEVATICTQNTVPNVNAVIKINSIWLKNIKNLFPGLHIRSTRSDSDYFWGNALEFLQKAVSKPMIMYQLI